MSPLAAGQMLLAFSRMIVENGLTSGCVQIFVGQMGLVLARDSVGLVSKVGSHSHSGC